MAEHPDNAGSSLYALDGDDSGHRHYKAVASSVRTILRHEGPQHMTVWQGPHEAVIVSQHGAVEVADRDANRMNGGEWGYIASAALEGIHEWRIAHSRV